MPIPDSFIQDVVERTDIEALVSAYVQVRRRGRTLVGLCPFHGEKTPSFTVYPETNSFYCFGCAAGGSVINFVMRIENLDYLDAVKFLAERAGLRMPTMESGVNDAASRLRMRVLEANREAARLFHSWLYAPEGRAGLEYYLGRGYTEQTIKRFGLGFALDSFDELRDALRGKGFHDEELLAASLCRRGAKGNVFDFFRNRVIIPVIDVRGNVIAFGGRVMDDSKPKYINSSDTPVYSKTDNLFALNFAKSEMGSKKQLILCEGYMDVIALHQVGIKNAVAALGTSFTAEHARLIARYAEEIVLTFDADAAGQKATDRAIDLLRQTGLRIKIVRVPEGKDPDEYIRTNGADRFRVLLAKSGNDTEYLLMELGRKWDLATPDGQVQYLKAATDLLAALPGPVERDVYAGRLAESMHVSKSSILEQIKSAGRQKQKGPSPARAVRRMNDDLTKKANPEAMKQSAAVGAEEALLGLLMQNPDFIPAAAEKLPPERMLTGFNRGLYAALIARQREHRPIELPYFAAEYNTDEMAYITRIHQGARDRENTLEEALRCAAVIERERRLQAAEGADSNEAWQRQMQALNEDKIRKDKTENGRKG